MLNPYHLNFFYYFLIFPSRICDVRMLWFAEFWHVLLLHSLFLLQVLSILLTILRRLFALVCVSEAHTQSSAITCFFVLLLTFFQLFSERSCSSIKLNLRSSLWDIHIDKVKVCNEQATLNALLFLPNSNIAAMKYSKEKHLGLFSYDTFIVNLSTCFNHFESKVQE